MTTGRQVAARIGPVSYALANAARAHRSVLQRRLAALGLHLGQELLLVDLHHHPDTTGGQLAERLEVEQPTVAKAIARMERSGFIERHPDEHDHRIVRLRLTTRGEAAVAGVLEAWAGVEAVATSGLDPAEAERFVALLTAVSDVMNRENGRI
jgi:MarR family transcriptional regulator, organic hydroperoxide resistance regulator